MMSATRKVRVEFPLGEVFTLGPLIALGIIPKPLIDPKGITKAHRFHAQGLEGLGYVDVDENVGRMLLFQLGKFRGRLVVK